MAHTLPLILENIFPKFWHILLMALWILKHPMRSSGTGAKWSEPEAQLCCLLVSVNWVMITCFLESCGMSEMLFKNLLMKVMSTDEVGQNKQKKTCFLSCSTLRWKLPDLLVWVLPLGPSLRGPHLLLFSLFLSAVSSQLPPPQSQYQLPSPRYWHKYYKWPQTPLSPWTYTQLPTYNASWCHKVSQKE